MMRFRCSSIGKLMTEPKSKSEILSVGAKTYIRELAAQAIFGIDFEISGKPIEKGIQCEDEAIQMLNRVKGLNLAKNTERRTDDFITGECDLFDASTREGRDIKCPWSAATFPITEADAENKLYEWQMRGYMRLWNARRWHVDYCLVDTPQKLIGFEPLSMHLVGHIPERMRVTTVTVEHDPAKEAAMLGKIDAARLYYAEVIAEFDKTHPQPLKEAA